MTFEEMIASSIEDFGRLEPKRLMDASCDNLTIFSKYSRLWAENNYLLVRSKTKLERLHALYQRILEGRGSAEENKKYPHLAAIRPKTKDSVEKVIMEQADYDILKEQVELQKVKVDFLKECMAKSHYRNRDIENCITLMKFESGLF